MVRGSPARWPHSSALFVSQAGPSPWKIANFKVHRNVDHHGLWPNGVLDEHSRLRLPGSASMYWRALKTGFFGTLEQVTFVPDFGPRSSWKTSVVPGRSRSRHLSWFNLRVIIESR